MGPAAPRKWMIIRTALLDQSCAVQQLREWLLRFCTPVQMLETILGKSEAPSFSSLYMLHYPNPTLTLAPVHPTAHHSSIIPYLTYVTCRCHAHGLNHCRSSEHSRSNLGALGNGWLLFRRLGPFRRLPELADMQNRETYLCVTVLVQRLHGSTSVPGALLGRCIAA